MLQTRKKVMPDYQMPRIVHEDIADIELLLSRGRLRSAVKLMMTFIETVVWLRLPADHNDTTKQEFCEYLERRVLPSMNTNTKPSAEEIWLFRNGALHTSSRRGQRGANVARQLNWSLERECGLHADVLIWPSTAQIADSVDIKVNDFWPALRRCACEDMNAALQEQSQVIVERLKTQMHFIRIANQPQEGYLEANAIDCATSETLEGPPMYAKHEPDVITIYAQDNCQ